MIVCSCQAQLVPAGEVQRDKNDSQRHEEEPGKTISGMMVIAKVDHHQYRESNVRVYDWQIWEALTRCKFGWRHERDVTMRGLFLLTAVCRGTSVQGRRGSFLGPPRGLHASRACHWCCCGRHACRLSVSPRGCIHHVDAIRKPRVSSQRGANKTVWRAISRIVMASRRSREVIVMIA